jgi:hypothetical protein
MRGELYVEKIDRVIRITRLELDRSRVGRYQKDVSLNASVPKAFEIGVPSGTQEYTFWLRALQAESMTVHLAFEPGPLPEPAADPAADGSPPAGSDTRTEEVEVLDQAAPRHLEYTLSIGLKTGAISPIVNHAGGTTPIGILDMRYALPDLEERLEVGLEVGIYSYHLEVMNIDWTFQTRVIPVTLNLYYRVPLADLFHIYFGVGAGPVFCLSHGSGPEEANTMDKDTVVLGAHALAGFEVNLGPGFALLELRTAFTIGDASLLGEADVGGLAAALGYRLAF